VLEKAITKGLKDSLKIDSDDQAQQSPKSRQQIGKKSQGCISPIEEFVVLKFSPIKSPNVGSLLSRVLSNTLVQHAEYGVIGVPTKDLNSLLRDVNSKTSTILANVLKRLFGEGQRPSSIAEIVDDAKSAKNQSKKLAKPPKGAQNGSSIQKKCITRHTQEESSLSKIGVGTRFSSKT
jgi:hypothetical protein